MKHVSHYTLMCLLILSALLTTQCDGSSDTPNDESEPELSPYPTLPFKQLTMSEVYKSDGGNIRTTHTFSYTDGRITGLQVEQHLTSSELQVGAYSYEVAYGENEAVVTDSHGNTLCYLLNERGYAFRCNQTSATGATRTYFFQYDANADGGYYLLQVEEYIGNDPLAYSHIDLTHNEGETDILQQIDQQKGSYTAVSTNLTPNSYYLPMLFLTEAHPLSPHLVALYGRLLGDPRPYLYDELRVNSASGDGEVTTYEYEQDAEGHVTTLKASLKSNGASIARTITYEYQ